MKKRLKNLAIFCGAFFIFAPFFVFAQEDVWQLKQKQALDILDIVRKVPLSKAQSNLFYESIYYPNSDNAAKTGAVVLTKQIILQNQLDYWLVKMPVEFSKRFIKAVYKLLPAVAYGDFSGAVDLIEKYTVEQANQYINDWLKQNQVQIGSGIGKYAFPSYKNNQQVINIPYIIVYSPIGINKAEIVVEFYSQKAIEPPIGTGTNNMGSNKDNPKTNCWPWDNWLQSNYNKTSKTPNKIEPFIVRVKGQVVKDSHGNFTWDKAVSTPTVEVEFGKPVPQIDKSDIILKDLEANKSQGFLKDKINQIKQKAQGIIDQVQQFLAIFKPQAQISSFVEPVLYEGRPSTSEWDEELDDLAEQGQIIVDHADTAVNEQNVIAIEKSVEKMQQAVEFIVAIATSTQQATTTAEEDATDEETTTTLEQTTTTTLCTQATNQESAFDKVIFNEIAWMGTTISTSDEWIELKNISTEVVDLNGWQIFNKKQSLKIFFSTTTLIAPGEFLLLERTDDNTVQTIKADLIYKGSIANTNEALYLVNESCVLQDKVEARPYWQEGDNITKETMERNQFFGWQTSLVTTGTPKAKNSMGKGKLMLGGGGNVQAPVIDNQNITNTTTTATSTTSATSTQQATSTQATTTVQTATSTQQATTTVQANLLDVVINEIAWMGTQASIWDEWIELYNNTDQEINLAGWKIVWSTTSTSVASTSIYLTGKISPRSFYLLERAEKATNIPADLIYGGQMISNDGVKLELKDPQGNVIDLVDCSAEWFAGDNSASSSRKTMERKSPVISGNDANNWDDNNGITINGLDAQGNSILGTPKAQNSVLENLAPEPPQNFNLNQDQTQLNRAVLTWATSTDLDTPTSQLSYIIYYSRYSGQLLDEQTSTSTNLFVQTATTSDTFLFLENLEFASVYYFSARAFDGFSYSAISSTTTMVTPLAPITNLMVAPSTVRGRVDLSWVCPYFNDYSTGIPMVVDSYIIKKSEQEITTTTWETDETIIQNISPKPAGEVEILSVDNLPSDRKTYFAIKYSSTLYVTSGISSNVSATAWPGFVDNLDGTLTDLRTGLAWFKDASTSVNNFGASSTQSGAVDFITQQNSDWRLPNFKELASLFNYAQSSPSVWSGFENIKPEKYWSSSKSPGWGTPSFYSGWVFDFSSGGPDMHPCNNSDDTPLYSFMASKGNNIPSGLDSSEFNFTDNNDGTIKDNRTGLMWLKAELAQVGDDRKTWDLAFNFASNAVLCNDGTLQGTAFVTGDCSANGGIKYDDWRLPNVQELVEITQAEGDNDYKILPYLSFGASFYWTSTLFNESNAWYAGDEIVFGNISYILKNSQYFNVQLVREN